MLLDEKSEIIAHFIGLFQLGSEAARMREEFEEFQALKNADPEFGSLLNITINLFSDYELGAFTPDIQGPLYFPVLPGVPGLPYLPFAGPAAEHLWPVLPGELAELPIYWSPPGYLLAKLQFLIPPPSSVATITVQYNFLRDYDYASTSDAEMSFVDPVAFEVPLSSLQATATALQPFSAPVMPEDEAAIAESGREVSEDIRALESEGGPGAADGAVTFVAFGEATATPTLNGLAVEEMPKLSDYSDTFAEPEPEPEEEVPESPFEDNRDEAEEDDHPEGQHVTMGENLLINQANVVMNWLDAPVFVVMGDVVVANAISQINVWNDFDKVSGVSSLTEAGSTRSVNASSIEHVANPVSVGEGAYGPGQAIVTRIEGNVINYNHIQQFNFAAEGDVLSLLFNASETFIQTGGNTLFNIADILELGFGYDLIVIGGNMIDVTLLTQMNVLLDADSAEIEGEFGGTMDTSGNLLLNYAAITEVGVDTTVAITEAYSKAANKVIEGGEPGGDILGDPAYLGTPVLRVLYIEGDYLDVQVIEQVNVLGDVDQVALAAETLLSAEGADVTVLTGGNELVNIASVTDHGVDSTVYTGGEAYSDAMLYQAEFISNDDPFALASSDNLASEAVLFLADDMLSDTSDGPGAGLGQLVPEEAPVDVMQTLVA
ncbi:hypothetical protein [Vannielia litorea]|uniref:Uncharacterized protein n=1 Tax=Vannielia litorea TaxID=1217970 RepID=A0A1N6E625_9RHOB|nr:hypothetical protein [Vannielia litorea]SIN78469.1 hypothetical protein SAMN05444002_0375 [Vannielia litorea]